MPPPLWFWFVAALLLGPVVGSFINVCVDRLPFEKSLFWPSSRCLACLRPVRWSDNIPVLSYLLLGGRCRSCRAAIPGRVLAVEVGCAAGFVAILFFETVQNSLQLDVFKRVRPPLEAMRIPLHHAVLFSFLLAAAVCDLAVMEIPLTITVPGTLVGLLMSALSPWPYPMTEPTAGLVPQATGVHGWPVWYPLPGWLPAGSWPLGLMTGLAGAVAGMAVLRGVAWLFKIGRGVEGLGLGDADLMMMVGAFLGWQAVILAFFVAVGPALVLAIVQLATKGDQPLPFGPSLALGAMLTAVFWPNIARPFALLFFEPMWLGGLTAVGAVILLLASAVLRLRGTPG